MNTLHLLAHSSLVDPAEQCYGSLPVTSCGAMLNRALGACARFDAVEHRALMECQEQQGVPRGVNGHAWNWIYYPNGTVIQFYPQGEACSVQDYSPFDSVFTNWTGSLQAQISERVNDINCTTYLLAGPEQHHVLNVRYAVSNYTDSVSVPVRLEYGLSMGISSFWYPFLKLDIYSFKSGLQADEAQYSWPSYCHLPEPGQWPDLMQMSLLPPLTHLRSKRHQA